MSEPVQKVEKPSGNLKCLSMRQKFGAVRHQRCFGSEGMTVGDGTVDVVPGVVFLSSSATLAAHIADTLAGLHFFSSPGYLPFFFTSPRFFLLFPSNRLFNFYLFKDVN